MPYEAVGVPGTFSTQGEAEEAARALHDADAPKAAKKAKAAKADPIEAAIEATEEEVSTDDLDS